MGQDKSEQELRQDTLARRARQDLKNTPLPLAKLDMARARQSDLGRAKSLTDLYDKCDSSQTNRRALRSLAQQRTLNNLSHSRSMQDLSEHSVNGEQEGLRRSKSYSRITDTQSSWEQSRASYRSTLTDMYTNTSAFSARSIAAIRAPEERSGPSLASTVLHLARPVQQDLRDPCWRAKRLGTGKVSSLLLPLLPPGHRPPVPVAGQTRP